MYHRALTVAVVALAVSGCSKPPTAPASPSSPIQPPAAPQAVLSIGDATGPPLGIAGGGPLTFDAAASTGAGLTYSIDFGDGTAASSVPVTRHALVTRSHGVFALTARLTVTDSVGRTASTTREYFVATLPQPSATFWKYIDRADRFVVQTLVFNQNGSDLSGWYRDRAGSHHFTGAFAGEGRTFTITTDDGIEFRGSVEWRAGSNPTATSVSAYNVILRLAGTRGSVQGTTLDFTYADPY